MVDLITTLAVIFITAGVFLIIANQFSLSPVPFFILAGILTGTVIDEASLLELAQWGIAFLVFVFGVGVRLDTVQTVFRDSEVTSVVQLSMVGAFGFLCATLLGFDRLNSVYFAIAAVLSSTIVGAGLLQSEIRNNLVYGRLAQSMHLVQDILAIIFILVLSVDVFSSDAIAANLGYGVILLVGALIIQRHIFNQLSRFAGNSQELMLMASISILICFLAAAEYVGISSVIGAFAAGLAIKADFTKNPDMLNGIESIKDFFVAIFFVTLGALVSIPSLSVVSTAFVLVVLTAILKPAVTLLTLLWEGYDTRTASLTSFSLDQVSEFTLIIAIQALIVGQITPTLFDAIILAAAVTMITSSYTRRHDEQLYQSLLSGILDGSQSNKIDSQSHVDQTVQEHVIIVGFGRQGRRIVNYCETQDRPYVVIENDPTLLAELESQCENYVFSDAMHQYTWEKARLEKARLIISTIDQKRVSNRILDRCGSADVILRSSDLSEAKSLLKEGALYVTVPDLLASEQLNKHVFQVITGSTDRERLRQEHLSELETLEDLGFDSVVKRSNTI
ncbi:potassium transporter Kef [Natronococcus sp. JC468]|uniref:cation:proton antiporter n=1 Tax=Natronococcus sp. JC468 TaxID=1961921 RepID=UPI001439C0CD|nr:cation:proton antiporter [Natronococcus sp. JC468]NKE37974.1 potassium transporter Kef [Natronococcus sp. JC468]